ncbi:hypothetical protein RIR_jg38812.t1 [Rhizophagus irregularis DAOM 181602=DAOM 197198]|nr:hypothetical protein RIR_jg38812.t1 [Rhizophagus irregularis DAOM 181602=DAOM 197198]
MIKLNDQQMKQIETKRKIKDQMNEIISETKIKGSNDKVESIDKENVIEKDILLSITIITIDNDNTFIGSEAIPVTGPPLIVKNDPDYMALGPVNDVVATSYPIRYTHTRY